MEKIKNTEGSAMIVGLLVSKWFGFCFGRLVNVRSVVLPLAITLKYTSLPKKYQIKQLSGPMSYHDVFCIVVTSIQLYFLYCQPRPYRHQSIYLVLKSFPSPRSLPPGATVYPHLHTFPPQKKLQTPNS